MHEHIRIGKELIQRFSGKITSRDIAQSVMKFHGDADFDMTCDVLWDFIEVTEMTRQKDIEEEIAAIDGAASISNSKIRIAVITNDPEIRKAAEYYRACGLSRYPLRLFSSVAEARLWFAEPYKAMTAPLCYG